MGSKQGSLTVEFYVLFTTAFLFCLLKKEKNVFDWSDMKVHRDLITDFEWKDRARPTASLK